MSHLSAILFPGQYRFEILSLRNINSLVQYHHTLRWVPISQTWFPTQLSQSLEVYKKTDPVIPFRSNYSRVSSLFEFSCTMTTFGYNPISTDTTNPLHKSLRLPRAYPRVARWLFGDPHLAFHNNIPLTPQLFSCSATLRTHSVYEGIGPVFDTFGIDEHMPDPDTSHSNAIFQVGSHNAKEKIPTHFATVTTDILYTPVARANNNVIVGYTHWTGDAFDPTVTHRQTGTFKGKPGMCGRFAYDLDNDHLIVVYNNITPLVSGIVEITFLRLTRRQQNYTVPNGPYGPRHLPKHVLVSLISLESRTDIIQQDDELPLPYASPNISKKTDKSTLQVRLLSVRQSGGTTLVENIADNRVICGTNLTRSDQFLQAPIYEGTSDGYTNDIEALVKDVYNLELSLKGVYSCRDMRRHFHDPLKSEIILSTEAAVVTGFHSVPTTEDRHKIIAKGWQAYIAWQCGEKFLMETHQDPSSSGSVEEDSTACYSTNQHRNS